MIVEREIAAPQLDAPSKIKGPWYERRGLRQFVKFCIVGGSNFVVYIGALNALYFACHAQYFASLTLAFVASVCNGFVWNRLWTFKESRHKAAHTQYGRFFIVNIVGFVINTVVTVLVIAHYTSAGGNLHGLLHVAAGILLRPAKGVYNATLVNGASLVAASVGVFWNFFANRLWTFKH